MTSARSRGRRHRRSDPNRPSDGFRVLVIGAGVSGLACARELAHRGYEVLVVEARNRVGGRLKGEDLLTTAARQQQQQQQLKDDSRDKSDGNDDHPTKASSSTHPIDLGGALIHGIDQNPIYSVASQMNVGIHPINDNCLLLDENGWPYDPKHDERVAALFNECLEETFSRLADMKRACAVASAGGQLFNSAPGVVAEAELRKKVAIENGGEGRHKSTNDFMGIDFAVTQSVSSDAEAAALSSSAKEAIRGIENEKGTEGNAVKASSSSSSSTNNTCSATSVTGSASPPSFGDVFAAVGRERGVNMSDFLWRWHQSNLELPTGASFDQLGYTWNDDEQYGFAGAHAAIIPSWRAVSEGLAEGLNILYDTPVRKIQVVPPKGYNPARYGDHETIAKDIIAEPFFERRASVDLLTPIKKSQETIMEDDGPVSAVTSTAAVAVTPEPATAVAPSEASESSSLFKEVKRQFTPPKEQEGIRFIQRGSIAMKSIASGVRSIPVRSVSSELLVVTPTSPLSHHDGHDSDENGSSKSNNSGGNFESAKQIEKNVVQSPELSNSAQAPEGTGQARITARGAEPVQGSDAGTAFTTTPHLKSDTVPSASTPFPPATPAPVFKKKKSPPASPLTKPRRSKRVSALQSIIDNAATVMPTSRRFSPRIRGDRPNVRRSTRVTKGVIQILSVSDTATLNYDKPTPASKKKEDGGFGKRKAGVSGARSKKRARVADWTEHVDDADDLGPPPITTVQVTMQNGTVLEANAVVCTLPLGILKIPEKAPGHVEFIPQLPPAKQAAIQQLGCGVLNKCALSFPSVFWQDSEFLGLACGTCGYLVLNTYKYTNQPILVFMYGGAFAKEIESWTDFEVVDDCLAVLKRICGKEVPVPIDYHVTRWNQEQFSKMAFTYIPPGVDGPTQLTAMGEAVYDPYPLRYYGPDDNESSKTPVIMFAGEHTTPYHPSTIHGAWLSGVREAYRLDLTLEPELNSNIRFEATEKLYQRTFPIRRKYNNGGTSKDQKKDGKSSVASKKSASLTSSGNGNATVLRRRRKGTMTMALRKQLKPVVTLSPVHGKKSEEATSTTAAASDSKSVLVPSRRSQRSLSTKRSFFDEEDFDKKKEPSSSYAGRSVTAASPEELDALEDRILLRSLESYGRDAEWIRQHCLPVYGSERRRTAEQIRSRWRRNRHRRQQQQLKPPSSAWESWIVPIDSTVSDPHELKHDLFAASSTAAAAIRRSQRAAKPRVPMDM